jgi:hypothetical protein
MKVVVDDDLSELHKITQGIAKKIAEDQSNIIIGYMGDLFKNHERMGDLGYSGAMTFINTIGSLIFCEIFKYSCFIGKQFTDSEHCRRDLFEEVHHGLRIYLDMAEISKTEYHGGIKKISIKDE